MRKRLCGALAALLCLLLATLKNGSYPWRKQLSTVMPLQPSPLAERFTTFLCSDRARNLLRRYDYLPSAP